jgi:hypothetical protein
MQQDIKCLHLQSQEVIFNRLKIHLTSFVYQSLNLNSTNLQWQNQASFIKVEGVIPTVTKVKFIF